MVDPLPEPWLTPDEPLFEFELLEPEFELLELLLELELLELEPLDVEESSLEFASSLPAVLVAVLVGVELEVLEVVAACFSAAMALQVEMPSEPTTTVPASAVNAVQPRASRMPRFR